MSKDADKYNNTSVSKFAPESLRNKFPPMVRKCRGLIGIGAFFLVWQITSLMFHSPIYPTPCDATMTLIGLFFSKLYVHLLVSLFRIAVAMVASVCIGVPLGILTGYFNKIDRVLSPVIHMLYPLPKIALLPIIMVTLGIGEKSKITMMILIIVFQIAVTVRDSVKNIPVGFYMPFYAVNAGFIYILRNIIFPASLGGIFIALKNSFGAAISVLFFSESYGTAYGMGFFILDAWMRVSYKQMYAGILALGILGISIYYLIEWIEIRVRKQ